MIVSLTLRLLVQQAPSCYSLSRKQPRSTGISPNSCWLARVWVTSHFLNSTYKVRKVNVLMCYCITGLGAIQDATWGKHLPLSAGQGSGGVTGTFPPLCRSGIWWIWWIWWGHWNLPYDHSGITEILREGKLWNPCSCVPYLVRAPPFPPCPLWHGMTPCEICRGQAGRGLDLGQRNFA